MEWLMKSNLATETNSESSLFWGWTHSDDRSGTLWIGKDHGLQMKHWKIVKERRGRMKIEKEKFVALSEKDQNLQLLRVSM